MSKLCNLLMLLLAFAIPAQGETVKIGLIAPLTGDGAIWGDAFKKGAELAVADINAERGEKDPAIELILEDDRCDPKQAVTAFQRLNATRHVTYFLGPICSSSTLAIAPLVARAKTPLIACSESADIPDAGGYLFQFWVPNDRQGRAIAGFAAKQIKRVAVAAIQNAYGASLSRAFRDEFQSLGGTIAAFEEYDPSQHDHRTTVLRLKAARPEMLLMVSYIPDGVMLLKQIRENNLSVPVLGTSAINSQEFFIPAGTDAEGLIFADLEDTTSAEFRERWQKTFKSPWPGLAACAPMGYDSVRLFAAALSKTSAPAQVARIIRETKDFPGVTGGVSFDENGKLIGKHQIFIRRNRAVQRYGE